MYQVQRLSRDELEPELESAWALVLREIDDIRHVCLGRDIPFLLVIAPYLYQLPDSQHSRQPQDRLIAWAGAHEVPYVDLLPIFASEDSPYFLFNDPNHFSPVGHQLTASSLFHPVNDLLDRAR